MVTLSDTTSLNVSSHEIFPKNSLLIPKIGNKRKRQELTDALQYCHTLLLQNGICNATASDDVSFRSKEIGQQMFFCFVTIINDILLKPSKKVSRPTKWNKLDSSNPVIIKEITANNVIGPDRKKEIKQASSKATVIEEIFISSSEDESRDDHCSVQKKSLEENGVIELHDNVSAGPSTNSSPKSSKSKKGKEKYAKTEKYMRFQIDTWVYKNLKILKTRKIGINKESIKQLAVKASGVYAHPNFKPTKKWLKEFLEMYNIPLDNDKRNNSTFDSLSTSEEENIAQGIVINVKGGSSLPFQLINCPPAGPISRYSRNSWPNPLAVMDLTPIQVDLGAVERKPEKSQKMHVKSKKTGKEAHKKSKAKIKEKNKNLRMIKINSFVYAELRKLQMNSIRFDMQTAYELATKAADIFSKSNFCPNKAWYDKFWKIYGKRLESLEEEQSNPTKIKKEKSLSPQPTEGDKAMMLDLQLNTKKEVPDTINISEDENPFSNSVEQESVDCIPLVVKKEKPVVEEICILSSEDSEQENRKNSSSKADRK